MVNAHYERKIDSSYRTFENLRYAQVMYETVEVPDDGKNHRIHQHPGKVLGAAINDGKGIAQKLIGLVRTPTNELFGIVKVLEKSEPDTPKYMVSRLPYGKGETRASIVGFIKENSPVTLAPSEESKQLYPDYSNWAATIDLQNERLGIEHAGQNTTAVLTPRRDIHKDTLQIPHELWSPPSHEVQVSLGERAFAGAGAQAA